MTVIDDVFGQARDWVVGHREPDLPRPQLTPALAAKWWIDEWALQIESTNSRLRAPSVGFRRRLRTELGDAVDMFDERGWTTDPRSYHRDPPPLKRPRLTSKSTGGLDYEHLVVASGYEPHDGEPGRDRWLGYEKNRQAHAWILRHDGAPRPWLICINGYRTGSPRVDFAAFGAQHLHHELGYNLAFPVTPLHGPRSIGASGDRVLWGGAMNTVHTAAQAIWDIRRLKSWITGTQGAPAVGASGISLGGYFTSLLTCFEDDLACAIAGVPEADLVRGMRRNVEAMLPPFYEQWGLSWRSLERANRVVSPMRMDPLVPKEALFIYGGLVDRWVRPGNVQALWKHWDEPEICWYEGSHLSFPFEPSVRRFVDTALADRLGSPSELVTGAAS
ncbi:MAG: alpha/beta hydrolase [Ilumatobacter sp.]|uniref:alpha/beta hydrolase family protein n=1 Tax=Ilumatobacter sp. TaxID=1967498 RepID=UPI003C73BBF3